MKLSRVSFVVPIFNEKKRLKKGITSILNYLQKQPYSWELIVVDDGSTDTTRFQIQPSASISIIKTKKNFGKGHAIRLGVEAATGNFIFFTDIDVSVPLTFIQPFLRSLQHSDVVIGSRRLLQSRVVKHQNFFREFLGHGFTQLSNLILGLHHSDFTCGFKGFKAAVAHDLFSRQKLNRWAFDSEVMFLAQKLKYKVIEIPVTWHNDPRTKVNLLKDTVTSLISLFQIRLIHL